MKRTVKFIIAGAAILVIGLCVFLTAFGLNGWKYSPKFEARTYTASGGIVKVEAEINAGTVNIEFYDGDRVYIEYPVAFGYSTNVSERNGTIRINNTVRRLHFTDIPATTVIIPYGTTPDINIELNAGQIKVSEGVFGEVDIELNAGEVTLSGMTCASLECDVQFGKITATALTCSNISAEVDMGEAYLQIAGNKADYTISNKVGLGSSNLSNQSGLQKGYRLDVEVNLGEIHVDFTG